MTRLRKICVVLASLSIIGYSLVSLMKTIKTFAADFSVYYNAGASILHGKSLYTNISFTLFAYPPLSSLLYIPFAGIPYHVAQGIFVMISYLCVFVSVLFAFVLVKEKPPIYVYLATVALTLFSFPTKFTLGMGQSNLLALVAFLAAVILNQKKKSLLAGTLFALAIIFKPIFVFFVLYFLFIRSFKTAAFTIGIGTVLAILQILLLPATFSNWQEYITHVLPTLFTTQGREVYYNQGMLGTVSRLVSNTIWRTFINSVGSITLLTAAVWVLSQAKRDNTYTLALFFCLLPMLDSLSWQHHFVILLFPMMYAFYALKNNTLLLTILCVAYLGISYNVKSPQHITQLPNALLLSHVFWGTLLLFGLLLYKGYSNRMQPRVRKR